MQIGDWLRTATARLADAGISTARLDCLVLLEDASGHDRAWLLSHPEHDLQKSELQKLNTKITRRANHVPLAYIRGHAEFYGRQFVVNAHTLVPRPETETIIDLLRACATNSSLPSQLRILDVGTGSGCIAITVALELPGALVDACDIDKRCLQTAAANAAQLAANVQFFTSDLLTHVRGERYDILLANLPYVPDNFQINTAATHEPRHALFGGPDGLDPYRTLFDQLNCLAAKPVYVITESLPPQHETLTTIAQAAGYRLEQTEDFIQQFTPLYR